MRWAEEALQLAHGGDAEATLLLALCLLRGYGVPQNVDKVCIVFVFVCVSLFICVLVCLCLFVFACVSLSLSSVGG